MDKVFSSWKEIAAYLGKGVRTVQRWEAELKLPVHRPSDQGIVLAYESELQQWARRKAERLNPQVNHPNGHAKATPNGEARSRSHVLVRQAGERIRELQSTLERTRQLQVARGTRKQDGKGREEDPKGKSVPDAA